MGHRTKRVFQWSGKMGERFWKPKGLGMIGKMGWIFRSGFSLYMGLHLLYVWGAFLRIFGGLLYIGFADGAKTAWKGFIFGCVAVFMAGLMDFVIWWCERLCGRFFVPIFKYSALKFFQISIIWYICSIIEMNMAKVIHVHLLHKIDGTKQKDWYFSSISAVYTVLTADQVGATKNYLLHAGLSGNGTICTKKAIIKQSTLISGGSKGNIGTI